MLRADVEESKTAETRRQKEETMQYVFRYNVSANAATEYLQWLSDHSNGRVQKAGWTYLGTWFGAKGFGTYDYESRWDMNGHGSASSRSLDVGIEKRVAERLDFCESGEVHLVGP
jgi:hypothetical protein